MSGSNKPSPINGVKIKEALSYLKLSEGDLEFKVLNTKEGAVSIDEFRLDLRKEDLGCGNFLKKYFEIIYGDKYIWHEHNIIKNDSVNGATIEGRVFRYS